MITKEVATSLIHGTILYSKKYISKQGKPIVCRVTGECKTWKKRPRAFRLPVKYGFRDCFYIDESNGGDWRKEDTNEVDEV